jgi:hypothetical protein
MPAPDFLNLCTGQDSRSRLLNLDLASQGREAAAEKFKNNWDVIVRRADVEPIERTSSTDEPSDDDKSI